MDFVNSLKWLPQGLLDSDIKRIMDQDVIYTSAGFTAASVVDHPHILDYCTVAGSTNTMTKVCMVEDVSS